MVHDRHLQSLALRAWPPIKRLEFVRLDQQKTRSSLKPLSANNLIALSLDWRQISINLHPTRAMPACEI